MNPGSIPVIKLTLESMQASILQCFSEQQVSMDEQVREAVTKFCTKENIQAILDKQTADAIESAIKAQIQSFFRYGAGQQVIKQAVVDTLEKRIQQMEDRGEEP